MITKMTGKNQVTVPAKIANHEKMGPGTRLDWQLTDEEHTLLVRVLPDSGTVASQLRGSGKRYLKKGTSAVDNLLRDREREEKDQL